jgi:hypothetical protein
MLTVKALGGFVPFLKISGKFHRKIRKERIRSPNIQAFGPIVIGGRTCEFLVNEESIS